MSNTEENRSLKEVGKDKILSFMYDRDKATREDFMLKSCVANLFHE